MLLYAIRMRIVSACLRSVFIDRAVVIRTEKRARHRLENLVTVLINPNVLLHELSILHSEMLGNALYVRVCQKWTRGGATIGTLQAIDARKGLLMRFLEKRIQLPWIDPLQLG